MNLLMQKSNECTHFMIKEETKKGVMTLIVTFLSLLKFLNKKIIEWLVQDF